jgi:diguanylate cyclase (GGDEF)-like protein
VLGLATLAALCQVHPASASGRPIRFDRITPDQGLSQNTVMCIFQDSRGFMWFGTEDGLNRYDGAAFTVYRNDPSDPTSLPADFVWDIAEDASGDLWIGTQGGGLARWERRTDRFHAFRHNRDDRGISSDNVQAVFVDSGGAIWIGTRDRGLDRFEPATGSFQHYRHVPNDPTTVTTGAVHAIYKDHSGALWVGTEGGLNRLDIKRGVFTRLVHDAADRNSLSDNRVRTIAEDHGGLIWVATFGGGLNCLDPGSMTFVRYANNPSDPASLSHDRVRAVLEDNRGRLWVGTSRGLNLLDRQRGAFSTYTHDSSNVTSLGDDDVMSLFQDRGGVLWVGTRSGGLSKWNPVTWSFGHYTREQNDPGGLSSNRVSAFSEDAMGRLWVGTFGGGLNILDRSRGTVTHFVHDPARPDSLSDDRVMALLRDVRGEIWVGTLDGGLNRLDPVTGRFKVYRHDPARSRSIGANGIMSLFQDSEGTLWVGTFGGGLNRYVPGADSFVTFQHDPANPNSIGSNRVTCMVEDQAGMMWVGTDGGGLNLFDRRTGTFLRLTHVPEQPTSLSSDAVISLHLEPSGRLWVGTMGSGLDTLEEWDRGGGKPRFAHFTKRDGLPNDWIYAILPDDSGHLWLSTNNGLSRFDPRSRRFKNYTASHGLQANEFNFGAAYRSQRGELFFGGVNGFNAFFAERLESNAHMPPVVLTSFLKLNKPVRSDVAVPELRDIELSYRDYVVTFEFAALDYAAPESNQYAYKLEGLAPDWIDLGSVHRVTYTNLAPGAYVLRVKAANNDGVWNNEGLSVAMRVVPPPWKTWWAYTLYVLTLGGLAFAVIRVERNKLRRKAQYAEMLEEEVKARTREIAERNVQLEDLNRKVTEASVTDSLTGLRNRRFLFEHVGKDIALVRRMREAFARDVQPSEPVFSFLMVDLDEFKPVNDRFGHDAGDKVLVEVTHLLQETCRESDEIIRWGGDEFLVVARESEREGASRLAERICRIVAAHSFDLANGQVVRTTCTIGFAHYPFISRQPHLFSWEQVLLVADRALRVAKKSSRNAWLGFLSTGESSSTALLFSLIQERPDQLVEEGKLGVVTSVAPGGPLTWR